VIFRVFFLFEAPKGYDLLQTPAADPARMPQGGFKSGNSQGGRANIKGPGVSWGGGGARGGRGGGGHADATMTEIRFADE